MSQANQLADMMLDDILEDTVDEMQRLVTNVTFMLLSLLWAAVCVQNGPMVCLYLILD